jgi:hypothetical protein
MKTKTRKRTTRIKFQVRLVPVLTLMLVLLASLVSSALGAPEKKPAARGVVARTVFKDPGLALPGATVVLIRKDDPKAKKLQETVSNYRGEFAFPVPAMPATYIVRASLKGFHPDEKEALISADERIEVTLVLFPESKK